MTTPTFNVERTSADNAPCCDVAAFDEVSGGIIIRNARERIIYANRDAYRLLDWPPSVSLVGRTRVRRRGFRIYKLDGARAGRPVAAVLRTGATIHGGRFLFRYTTGETRFVSADWVPVFDQERMVRYVLTNFVDIHAIEQRQELQAWLLQDAFQVISGACLMLENHLRVRPGDEAGDIAYVVEALRQLASDVRTRARN